MLDFRGVKDRHARADYRPERKHTRTRMGDYVGERPPAVTSSPHLQVSKSLTTHHANNKTRATIHDPAAHDWSRESGRLIGVQMHYIKDELIPVEAASSCRADVSADRLITRHSSISDMA